MSIHANGYWEGLEASSQHVYDSKLGDSLANFFLTEKVKSVVDLGCGMGNYVKTFRLNNINAIGFDGNPNTPELTNNLCKILDLSIPKQFDEPFDWVMSIEVGEHLPPQFEDIFIHNLHNNNKCGIVLSWAIKGQGGHGHFNEQNNDYIKSKICDLGYINDIEIENNLRHNSTLRWFKNTIMVFRKIEVLNT
jgi:cyclopropane fatty-acyl-phospholipid synthase-like methyltransferase